VTQPSPQTQHQQIQQTGRRGARYVILNVHREIMLPASDY